MTHPLPDSHLTPSELHAIIANDPYAIILLDHQGRILEFNQAAGLMFGAAREHVLGRFFADCISITTLNDSQTDGFAEMIRAHEKLATGQRIFTTSRRSDGTSVPVEIFVTIGERDGQPYYILYLRDLTERTTLESQLRQVAQVAEDQIRQLAAIVESIADAVLVGDAQGRITRMNPAGEELLARLLPPDLWAKPAAERAATFVMRDEAGEPIPPNQSPMVRVANGERLAGVDIQIADECGGTLFLNVSGTPLFDAQGQPTGSVMVAHDVTERRQMERRTRAALEAVLTLAHALVQPDIRELAPDIAMRTLVQDLVAATQHVLGCQRVAIYVEAGQGRVAGLAVVGLRPEQEPEWRETSQGRTLGEGLPPEMLQRLYAGETILVDMTRPPFDDRPNPHGARVIAAVPMRVGTKLVGLLIFDYGGAEHVFTHDELALAATVAHLAAMVIEREQIIQEREAARAEVLALAEANRRMDAFLNLASHEMRTPLTHFKGGVQLALRRLERLVKLAQADQQPITPDLLQPIQSVLAQTDQHTSRMSRLVNDLLEGTRIQLDEPATHPIHCDLGDIVRQAVEAQRVATADRAILMDLPDGAVMVDADADRVGQVVLNYLTNAIKFAPPDRPITVRLTVQGDQARVAVHDEGPGVPPAYQEQIWERGYRVAGTEVANGSDIGLGLGLFLARSLIERQQGQVGVQSEDGKGATFWFTLPLIV
jgi:PAS domain S-box-containing protein